MRIGAEDGGSSDRRSYVFSVCNLEGRKTKKTRVIPSRGDGEGPPSCKFDHTIDQSASIKSRRVTNRESGHRLAPWERVYSWSAIHHRLSNAISDCEVPRRLTRLGMTPFRALNRYRRSMPRMMSAEPRLVCHRPTERPIHLCRPKDFELFGLSAAGSVAHMLRLRCFCSSQLQAARWCVFLLRAFLCCLP